MSPCQHIFRCVWLYAACLAANAGDSPWTVADKVDGDGAAQVLYLKPDKGDATYQLNVGITYRIGNDRPTREHPNWSYHGYVGVAAARSTATDSPQNDKVVEAAWGARILFDPIFWEPSASITYKLGDQGDKRSYVARWKNRLSGDPLYDLGFYNIGIGFLQTYNEFGMYADRVTKSPDGNKPHATGGYLRAGFTLIPPLPTGRWGINVDYSAARDTSITGGSDKRSTQLRAVSLSFYLGEPKARKADSSIPRITYEWSSGANHLEDKAYDKHQQVKLEYRFN